MEDWELEVCRKLRDTEEAYGKLEMQGVVIVGTEATERTQLGGHMYICAPTLEHPVLAGCSYETARFFEEV